MTTNIREDIHSRAYAGDDDFRRVRKLLIETYPITPSGFNWEIRRWDGWNCHNDAANTPDTAKLVRLWETGDSTLVGVVHPEGQGDLWLELHPDYRHLEPEMLAWGEAHLSVPAEDGGARQIETFVYDYDAARLRLIQAHGYELTPYGSVFRRLRFGSRVLPSVEFPPGYRMRTTRPGDFGEGERMAALLNAAFRRTIHTGQEYINFISQSPSFRHDLNLVAEASDGSFAAHVGVTYNDDNLYGIFEPVCTHPDHQRKGLARALMIAGLHRLKTLGATDAYVGTGDDMAANWLYEAVGFTEVYHGSIWQKRW